MYNLAERFPVIETERLRLRRITLRDRFDVYEIFSCEETMKYYGIYAIKDIGIIENMILDYEEGYFNDAFIRWGIEIKEDKKVIGTCGFHNWNKKYSKCEVGYELNKAYHRNGYMEEALEGVIQYCFRYMDVNRIEAQTYPENEASFKLLEKLGFKREGLLRETAFFRDKFQDLYMYSLLKSEYDKNK